MSLLSFDTNLPDAILQADNLPSLPAIAMEVLRLTQDENSTIDALAGCLSRDPALSAKILKLSNSPMFNMGQEVTSLQRATMVLGLKTVKLMSLSFSLVSEIPAKGNEGGFDMMVFWKHSLIRSVSARSLAKFTQSKLGDEAFLCGLLANFGRLILSRVIADEYSELLSETNGWPSLQMEEKRLGFSNTDVCATLLKQWNVPEIIYMATGFSSHPDQLPEETSAEIAQLVKIQHMSSLVETILCDEEKGEALRGLHDLLNKEHDYSASEVDAFLIGLESGITETADLFSLKLPNANSHDDIMTEAKLQMVNVSLGTAMDLRNANIERDQMATEKESLLERATTDSLTSLPNRSAFDDFMETQVASRTAVKKPLALGLVMIDIDHFKSFNNTYGHAAGDEILRAMGAALKEVTRKGDLAARYGGEEFAVIAPKTNPFNLKIMANRLRKAIEEIRVDFEEHTFLVTASIGAACISEFDGPEDAEKLVKLADAFLYKAKDAGRNRVEAYKNFRFPD